MLRAANLWLWPLVLGMDTSESCYDVGEAACALDPTQSSTVSACWPTLVNRQRPRTPSEKGFSVDEQHRAHHSVRELHLGRRLWPVLQIVRGPQAFGRSWAQF